jgi:hypothetical protein
VAKKLAPGVYRLTRDVDNPHPEPRKRIDWTLRATWKQGQTFVIEPTHRGSKAVLMLCAGHGRAHTLWQKPRYVSAQLARVRAARFAAIAAALEPIEEDVDALFTRLGAHAWDLEAFVKWLVTSDVMTVKRLEELLATWSSTVD